MSKYKVKIDMSVVISRDIEVEACSAEHAEKVAAKAAETDFLDMNIGSWHIVRLLKTFTNFTRKAV